MAELVEVATALTSPCDNTLICAGINSSNAVAQSGRATCGFGSQLDATGSDEACHVKLDHFSSVGDIDPLTHQAWLGAGAKLHDLSPSSLSAATPLETSAISMFKPSRAHKHGDPWHG